MDKKEFIEYLNSLPDDITILASEVNQYGCMNIYLFNEHKDDDFLSWYFGP